MISLFTAFVAGSAPLPALADEADDAFAEGVAAEASYDFAHALGAYERAIVLRPSASFALRARTRAEELHLHAEGAFVPLAVLERVRRDPAKSSDPTALDGLYGEVRTFPPGRVRTEALLLIAEGFARRVRAPARAIAPAQAIVADPAIDRVTRSLALAILVDAELALGETSTARRIAAENRALSPLLAQRMEQRGRRAVLVVGAEIGLAALAFAALGCGVWRARRDGFARLGRVLRAPISVAVAAIVALGGAVIANAYDESITVRPFFLLGAGILVIDRGVAVVRDALGAGTRERALAATGGLLAVAMAAILALAWSDPAFIESFGL